MISFLKYVHTVEILRVGSMNNLKFGLVIGDLQIFFDSRLNLLLTLSCIARQKISNEIRDSGLYIKNRKKSKIIPQKFRCQHVPTLQKYWPKSFKIPFKRKAWGLIEIKKKARYLKKNSQAPQENNRENLNPSNTYGFWANNLVLFSWTGLYFN